MNILIEVAPGELIDKLTILEIKSERIKDPNKLVNIEFERRILAKAMADNVPSSPHMDALWKRLKSTNEEIWDLEDRIRDCERSKDFGEAFLVCARAIYHTNDRRASLKREINVAMNSQVIEEKSYTAY
jgi:hypothetical protein